MSDDLQYELAKMKVGERIATGDMEVMSVPNGWIFYRRFFDAQDNEVNGVGTFVPNMGAITPKTKKKPIILTAA